jgi:hypothetical protein
MLRWPCLPRTVTTSLPSTATTSESLLELWAVTSSSFGRDPGVLGAENGARFRRGIAGLLI